MCKIHLQSRNTAFGIYIYLRYVVYTNYVHVISISREKRSLWAILFTWETVPINKYFCANYNYTLTLIKREKTLSSFWELNAPYLFKLKFPSHNDALCQVWLKLTWWLWSRRLLNFINEFHSFVIISPGKRALPFIWINPLIPFTKGCFV